MTKIMMIPKAYVPADAIFVHLENLDLHLIVFKH